MIDIYAAEGTFTNKRTLAQNLAQAVIRHAHHCAIDRADRQSAPVHPADHCEQCRGRAREEIEQQPQRFDAETTTGLCQPTRRRGRHAQAVQSRDSTVPYLAVAKVLEQAAGQ